MKITIREAALWLGMFFFSILIGATIYQMLVIVPEFTRDIPHSMINFARGNIHTFAFWASPILPVGFFLVVIALVLNWKTPRKKWLIFSISLAVVGEIITILLVYPQLKLMGLLDGMPTTDVSLLAATIKNFVVADQLRFFLLAIPSFFFYLKALTIRVE